jgi:hypothetical protein
MRLSAFLFHDDQNVKSARMNGDESRFISGQFWIIKFGLKIDLVGAINHHISAWHVFPPFLCQLSSASEARGSGVIQ